jgi:hypothetical protein
MNLQQVKQLAQQNPKRIGEFQREKCPSLKATTKVNWMPYQSPSGRMGASIGDGHIYAVKAYSTGDSPKVLAPDTSNLLV